VSLSVRGLVSRAATVPGVPSVMVAHMGGLLHVLAVGPSSGRKWGCRPCSRASTPGGQARGDYRALTGVAEQRQQEPRTARRLPVAPASSRGLA
jgi:hypothetical protein